MRLFLAHGVHAVSVAHDLVFLDTEADAYFCLGGAAEFCRLGPGGQIDVTAQEVAVQLLGAGLLSEEATPERPSMPVRPTASTHLSWQGETAVSAAVLADAVRVTITARRVFPRSSFAQLLRGPPPAGSTRSDPTPALIEALAQFEQLRPWLPLDGECLLRSYHLRAFLRRRGHDALWVFGVRTWPFGAHCWLQVGETVLDEDLERLAAYQPIMAA